MPLYHYTCEDHGSFTHIVSLDDYDQPQKCPICQKSAARNLLSIPNKNVMGGRAKGNTVATGRKVKHAAGCVCGSC